MLAQIIKADGNANHDVIITRCWIYDSDYKRALNLMK